MQECRPDLSGAEITGVEDLEAAAAEEEATSAPAGAGPLATGSYRRHGRCRRSPSRFRRAGSFRRSRPATSVATNTAFVSINNFHRGDFKPYVLKTTDLGRTWTSIAGDLPQRDPVWAVVQDNVNPNLLFVGTEFGMSFSVDGGARWVPFKSGMPTINIREIEIQKRESDLVAASFGRGFFVVDDYSPLRHLTAAPGHRRRQDRHPRAGGARRPVLHAAGQDRPAASCSARSCARSRTSRTRTPGAPRTSPTGRTSSCTGSRSRASRRSGRRSKRSASTPPRPAATRRASSSAVHSPDADEIIDATPEIETIHATFIGDKAFSNLPRKFKTSISGCAAQCSHHEINDVAFAAVQHPATGETGYDLWVGGGLSTNPMIAQRLG